MRPRVEADGVAVVMHYSISIYNRSYERACPPLPDCFRFSEAVMRAGGAVELRFWREDAGGPALWQSFYGRRSASQGLVCDRFSSLNLRGVKKLELTSDETKSAT